jgi:oligoendopeptidase F
MKAHRYAMKWDLDVFFKGGSESEEFKQYVERLEQDAQTFDTEVKQLPVTDTEAWKKVIRSLQDVGTRLSQAHSFVSCLTAQNVKDEQAKLLQGRLSQLDAALHGTGTRLDQKMLEVSEKDWEALLKDPEIQPVSFKLREQRRRAKEKMAPELESLVGDLSVDGYHAWGDLYDTIVGRMSIPFEEDGEVKELSVGQANNKLHSSNRQTRQQAFRQLSEAWEKELDLCASALNHLAGYRLNLYRNRGWDSVLKEPVDINRMSEATLQTMWDVISQNKGKILEYMKRKASLLGLKALSWYDIYAPVSTEDQQVSYDEAANFITEQFGRFSPAMANFAKTAFELRWIEAEDRPGKRPGGFCTTFPESGQSRIFMTYAGTASNVATLAHELGHAYHSYVMRDLPSLARRYSMSVAETASTFAETLVANAAIQHAATKEQKIALLEDKLQRAVAFFMDIHARFLFETRYYEKRRKGLLTSADLNQLTLEAEKEAFQGALEEYHPHFWASKLHFYITEVPFYNFPYTFGYLFSTGIYARAQQEGPAFAERYVALLRDTGSMTVEELAQKHLGVDLTRPDFWQSAIRVVHEDVDRFLQLTGK